jgi:VCBS repeat-containing protein
VGSGAGTVAVSYWDAQTTHRSTSAGGTGLTTAELTSGTLPDGFDPTKWFATAGQYPELSWRVTIPTNQPPVVSGPVMLEASAEDTERLIDAAELLANASDVESTTLLVSNLTASSGTLVDNSNGIWTFTPAVDDDTAVTFSYEVSDGALSTPAGAILDLTAMNDDAIINGTSTGTVTEDSILTASGILTIVDPDAGEASFQGATIPGRHGNLVLDAAGAWTYTLDNAHADVQALDAGQGLSESLSVRSVDGTMQAINIVINGANDVISNGNVGGTITGTAGNDLIDGQGGADTINASSGNDTITGGTGIDFVNAGPGDDIIVATTADDRDVYAGSAGVDTLDMSAMNVPLIINLNGFATSTQSGLDGLISIENAIGGSRNDTMTGNRAANVLDGQAGNDTINAGDGADIVIGGIGNDTMNGGAGNDIFVFAPGFGNDRIQSFDANPAGGQDRLDISAFGIRTSDFATRVAITDVGADTLVTVDGIETMRLIGIGNAGTVTIDEFGLLVA